MEAPVLIFLPTVALAAIVGILFVPWEEHSTETCTKCGTVRRNHWTLLGGHAPKLDDGIGQWYARRVEKTHEHSWIRTAQGGRSLFGLSSWACACLPGPIAENCTAIVLALDRLEKLDLDRAYFRPASSDEWRHAACDAANYFPFNGGDDEVRRWWEMLQGWVNAPVERRANRYPWRS